MGRFGERSRSKRTVVVAALVASALEIPGVSGAAAPPRAGFGPLKEITCPADVVEIEPGENVPDAVAARPAGTAFCLKAGVHQLTGPISPRTGDSFIGEFGAVLDGSAWQTDDPNQGLFRAHNQDIDNVVIRNLVIRHSPQRGIHAYTDHTDGWIIEHNDIRNNRVGVQHGNSFRIRGNLIRENWQYGIAGFRSKGSVIERNKLMRNAERYRQFPGDSGTSKWAQVTHTIVRGNIVTDNFHMGIWFDGGHRGIRIVRNVVRRNGANGIFTEVGGSTIIRRNLVVGHHRGIYISESRNTRVRRNRLANNDRAIWLFQDGNRRAESQLRRNRIIRNKILVPRSPVVPGVAPMATGLSCANLTARGCAVYSNRRGNVFHRNAYKVANSGTRYWYWRGTPRTWSGWRAVGQDHRGRLSAG